VGGSEPSPTGGNGNYAVFKNDVSQASNFCYSCHGSGGEQTISNYSYSYRYGGYTGGGYYSSIQSAFTSSAGALGTGPSAHKLSSIDTWAMTMWSSSNPLGWVSGVTNPCLACHDVHRAMRVTASTSASNAAIYIPQAHNKTNVSPQTQDVYRRLWGDDTGQTTIIRQSPSTQYIVSAGERQNDLANWASGQSETRKYLAPYSYSGSHNISTGPFEPAGDSTSDGSNAPNYTEFCLSCHRVAATGVIRIRWDPTVTTVANRDIHGLGQEQSTCASGMGDLKPPYVATSGDGYPSGTCSDDSTRRGYNYILGCLDCHEPHGSPLPYLLRTEVNGHVIDTANANNEAPLWRDFCGSCHDWSYLGMAAHETNLSYCKDSNCHGHSAQGSGLPQF
jgi:hypothetical protein